MPDFFLNHPELKESFTCILQIFNWESSFPFKSELILSYEFLSKNYCSKHRNSWIIFNPEKLKISEYFRKILAVKWWMRTYFEQDYIDMWLVNNIENDHFNFTCKSCSLLYGTPIFN